VRYKRLIVKLSNPEKYILDFYQKINITLTFFNRNELRNHAAACAYYMLLSMIPMVLVLFYIFDTFLEKYPQFSNDLFVVLSVFNENITPQLFERFGISKLAGNTIGVLGILNLMFSSRLILTSVQRAFSVIFPAEKRRNFFLENAISLGVLPFVFVVVILIGVLNTTKQVLYKYLQINGVSTYYIEPLINAGAYIIPAMMAMVVVYITYRYLPVKKPGSKSATKGTLMFLVVFVGAKSGAVIIFKHIAFNSAYGILGSLIVVLVWSYFIFLLFLFCAQYVYVTYKADILILNRLFSDDKPSDRFIMLNKKILEKYTVNLKAGDVLLHKGDESDSVYYVLSGILDAVIDGDTVGMIKSGEVFGEMAYMTGEARSATVRAASDSEVVVLPPKIFEEIIRDNTDFARKMMETMCSRLKRAQQRADHAGA
jgi:membrane protein